MRSSASALALAAVLIATLPASGQQQETDAPLSAIDWLSDVTRNPDPAPQQEVDPAQDVARSAVATVITTTPLDKIKLDAVGLLPRSRTGLPADFWTHSSVQDISARLRSLRSDMPPPLAQFLSTLLLAELSAPADSADGAEMFLARVDKFLEMGALDQAQALMLRAGPTREALFGRWFDVSLLIGEEDDACRAMLQTPSIAPTYPARIFCLARAGDWDAAALTIGTGKTLGLISERDEALLARFLDPELFEGEPLLPVPERVTPLNFRLHEAIGEPLGLGGLPHAFAYRGLSDTAGWKSQLSAAERLVRTSAIPPDTLISLYTERRPAASGGVWDRARAIQRLDQAIKDNDLARVSVTLGPAMRAMRIAGLEHGFAQSYGPQLMALELEPKARMDAARAAFLSKAYETAANSPLAEDVPPLWSAIAKDQFAGISSDDALEAAIIAGFTTAALGVEDQRLLDNRRLGELTLHVMARLADGPRTDPADVESGLAALKALGLNDLARQTALHMLLSRPRA